jgi:hypothetical protein
METTAAAVTPNFPQQWSTCAPAAISPDMCQLMHWLQQLLTGTGESAGAAHAPAVSA